MSHKVSVTRKVTIALTRWQVSEVLREHFKTPDDAGVEFDVSYDTLEEVRLSWSETSEEER